MPEGGSTNIQHSLDSATVDILMIAESWNLDPDTVAGWSMPDFTDREEFTLIRQSLKDNNG